MTLQQFANLSKGMNGPVDFKEDFLLKIYKSIEKTQLGFH
jgi:Sec7-like guanine-nucleotide exchange factor